MMKRIMENIFKLTLVSCLLIMGLSACHDQDDERLINEADNAQQVDFHLLLSLPEQSTTTRLATTSGGDDETTAATAKELLIANDDVYVLRFDEDGAFVDYISDMVSGGQDAEGNVTLKKTVDAQKASYSLMVLTNLQNQGVTSGTDETSKAEIKDLLDNLKGSRREAVKAALKYTFKEKWEVGDHPRRIPMWGTYTDLISFDKATVSCSVNLYRAVAKIDVLVNAADKFGSGSGLTNFKMTSIRVYYALQDGYCAPVNVVPNDDQRVQFTETSIPEGADRFTRDMPLVWELTSDDVLANTFRNQIYLPESHNSGKEDSKVKIVIGGRYSGDILSDDSNATTYYRIDLADKTKNKVSDYDLIRNHSYVFNIKSVNGPGTPTPDEALDQDVATMKVEVSDIVEHLRGINTQYTLTTDNSVLQYDYNEKQTKTIHVGIENIEDWTLEIEDLPSWCRVVRDGSNVKVTPISENASILRQAVFYIKAGNIKKQIIVEQGQPETANCYLVDEGVHSLNVTIKGNGKAGQVVEGKSICDDLTLTPKYLKIIWETTQGLVKLKDASGNYVIGSKASYDTTTGTLEYKVDTSKTNPGYTHYLYGNNKENLNTTSDVGGNALIGAYDENDKIIWSWHIWVCPDLYKASDAGNVNSGTIEDWTLNGYKMMDRNLGALSNQPGVSSLGLLYQWGRKDPFIGADAISETANHIVTTNNDAWGVHDEYDGGTRLINEKSVFEYITQNPQKLIQDGMSVKLASTSGNYLWGTTKGFVGDATNVGLKTVYDPCPPGYRVPPVDTYVFKKTVYWSEYNRRGKLKKTYPVEKSSLKYNWNENLLYVPHCVYDEEIGNQYQRLIYEGPYVEDAPYYGIFLNYEENKVPTPRGWEGETYDTQNGILSYISTDDDDFYYYNWPFNYYSSIVFKNSYLNKDVAALQVDNQSQCAWFPLSGAYDPGTSTNGDNKGFKFDGVDVTRGSSITVNSFLWTNSTLDVSGVKEPGAMFLHGTEKGSSRGSGRHIHALTGMHDNSGNPDSDDIHAEAQQASAVRCIRDIKKDFSAQNIVPETISLESAAGSQSVSMITSINQSWSVVDPGAPWVVMSPDVGEADNGNGTSVTFTAQSVNDTGKDRMTSIVIQIEGETTSRTIIVTQSR